MEEKAVEEKQKQKQKQKHNQYYTVQLTDEYIRSIQCHHPKHMDMAKLDPSLALGFYCKDEHDFQAFQDAVQRDQWVDEHGSKMAELFSIQPSKPDYSADVSSAMVDMMESSVQLDVGDEEGGVLEDDDDDFVLL